jgi:hypothetical protein
MTGSTPPPVNNTQAIVVDYGPTVNGQPAGYNNALYTSVVVCVPGTTTCQTIDHVLLDTGSSGLRIVSSVIGLTLPYTFDASGNKIGNCIQYADSSYQWGPVVQVDIQLAGEAAANVPIQVVGAGAFNTAPTACSAGGTALQTVLDMGANGVLGLGNYR